MNKKFLSLVLALVLVLGTFTAVFAAEKTEEAKLTNADAKVQWLIDNKIVEGRKVNENAENNELALDKNITRAEVTKLIVYALGYEDLAKMLDGAIKAFPDVELNHWANGYISVATTQRASVANNRRIAIGYPDGKFLPENDVTYAELATMLVRIVDKNLTDKMEDNAIWATSYMSWAAEAKILDGLTIADSDKATNRKDAFVMLYNALYELGKANYNKVDFGEKIGVVSKLQSGKIQLNQDTKQEYKITWNTVVSKGSTWGQLAENTVAPGGVVRLIANADGEVTHIIQLGYDGKANDAANWKGVADKAVSGVAEFDITDGDSFKNITIKTSASEKFKAELNSDTKYFVADKDKNVYKEVAKLSDVFNYVRNSKGKEIEKVYMGYNEFGKSGNRWNEAKVVVFGKVDKDFFDGEVVRVAHSPNSKYNFVGENYKGETKTYQAANSVVFPGTYDLDGKDVVEINSYGENLYDQVKTLIDYSKDNVYKVTDIDRDTQLVEIKDYNNRARSFRIPANSKIFLLKDFEEKAHVQIAINETDGRKLDAISVVTKELKGLLPEGKEEKVTGKVIEVVDTKLATIEVKGVSKLYYVAGGTTNLVEGREYEFKVTDGDTWGTYPIIYLVETSNDQANKDAAKAFANKIAVLPTEADVKANLADAEKVLGLLKEYDALDADVKEILNDNYKNLVNDLVALRTAAEKTAADNAAAKKINDELVALERATVNGGSVAGEELFEKVRTAVANFNAAKDDVKKLVTASEVTNLEELVKEINVYFVNNDRTNDKIDEVVKAK